MDLVAYPLRVDGVEVTFDLAEDCPDIWADAHQLHQVVVNLVTNAQHAMREAAPPRRLTLSTGTDASGARVVLAVADSGPGIPPGIQARIFEPFFTTKPVGQGTGLGLPLCLGIIEAHGGTMRVESQPGRGTVFAIELPIDRRGAEPAVEPSDPIRSDEGGKRVLVVDDEPEISSLLADTLGADGHQVETAANGAIALQMLHARTYDVIVSDLRMPELDGPGLYREVERWDPELAKRFIFLSGDTMTAQTRELLEGLHVPSVSKPFEPDEVRRAVSRIP
jgi:two-component system NtrC family sensor kinase